MKPHRWLDSMIAVVAIAMLAWGGALTAQEKPAEPEKPQAETKDEKKKPDLPLEATRKIEFTTDEATWISLDVAPDGKTIVFELLGDLYTIPIEGGEAKRITNGMGFDSQPRYSPDGKWLAFVSDRDGADNIWIAHPDGSEPKKLSKETRLGVRSPIWTNDSQYVVATKLAQGSHFWMYHVMGGSGINITGAARPAPAGPGGPPGQAAQPVRQGAAFSPDNRYLYFAQKRGGTSVYNQMDFGWQIARRDMETGDVDTLTQAQGGAIRPMLSPDGKWLVYATRFETQTGLRIRNLDSGEDRWLKYPIQRDDMESGGTRDLLPAYAFTPDGREVLVTFDGKINRVSVANGESRVVPFTAKVALDLGPLQSYQRRVEEGPVRSRLIQDPKQSPDGKRVVFSAMTKLYVMDIPRGNPLASQDPAQGKPKRLTGDSAFEFKPVWSPDGQWIAFVTWNYEGDGHVWRIRADGAGLQRLTNVAAFYTDLAYSPDGERIVARRGNAWMRTQSPSEFGGLRIPLDVVWLPAAGGAVTMIVPARGLGQPHFTTQKERIYFYSNDGIISMRYDGTDRRTHIKITAKQLPGQQQPSPAFDAVLSPDGRWALANVFNELYVLAVPAVGGSDTAVNVGSPSVPSKQITDIGADSFAWADDGKTVTWAVGSTYFRRPFDTIDFEPAKKEDEEKKEGEAKPEGDAAKKDEAKPAEARQEGEKKEEKKDEKKKEVKKAKETEKGVESFEVALEFPRHKPQGTVVLRGATVITMKGEEVVSNADVVVTENRIAGIGARGKVSVPAGARIVDVKGAYIVPGFVDAHAHYEMRTEGVLETHNWSFLANLAYGVTSGLDVQTSTNDYLTYFDLVEAGMMLGPRAYSTGPGVFGFTDFQTPEAAKFYLEKYKKYYRNDNLKSYVVGNRKQRQFVVQAANELGLTVTTEGALDLKLDMTHAIDGFGGNEHTLPIVPLYKDVVELFAQSKTAYTPTLLVLYGGPWAENYYYQTTEVHDDKKLARFTPHNDLDDKTRRRPWFRNDEHSFPKAAAQAAKIQRAGGRIGVGGHGQLQGLGFHWEMWSLASGGMTPREVLRAATIDGADIVGLRQDLGSLEPGKLADLVVLEKNPLDDIKNTNTVRYVMKNGELFEADTLKQIWPTEKELPPFWWWKEEVQGKSQK